MISRFIGRIIGIASVGHIGLSVSSVVYPWTSDSNVVHLDSNVLGPKKKASQERKVKVRQVTQMYKGRVEEGRIVKMYADEFIFTNPLVNVEQDKNTFSSICKSMKFVRPVEISHLEEHYEHYSVIKAVHQYSLGIMDVVMPSVVVLHFDENEKICRHEEFWRYRVPFTVNGVDITYPSRCINSHVISGFMKLVG